MPDVVLENVCKVFPDGAVAVSDLSLHVRHGELLVLVGPSGSGKTTTLRLIAGLEQPNGGGIHIDGKVITHQPPAKRDVAMVFQRPALYPHRTVRDNLGFSLRMRQDRWWSRLTAAGHRQKAERNARVEATAKLLDLQGALERYPAQLSGGQQQRVALGRAIVRQASVLLLDEPLSNLDTLLRQELRRELHLLQRQLQATMIYVTHDPLEALSLGDRVAVMHGGKLQQIDEPDILLRRPANRFVAGFVGWPAMNFLDGELVSTEAGLVFVCCAGRFPVLAGLASGWQGSVGRPLMLGIRPEAVQVVNKDCGQAWPMRVELLESVGLGRLATMRRGSITLTAWLREGCQIAGETDTIRPGSDVMVQLQLDKCQMFDRASGTAVAFSMTG